MRRFLDGVDRAPAALLMEGEPGIGKTVLWRAGVELARARGLRVLTAIPATAETRLSFAALADLLGPVLAATGGLTPTERRIAALAAEGRSNKEIATALFITPKTVGTQLSRIYRKLGVHSRTELARHISGDPESPKV